MNKQIFVNFIYQASYQLLLIIVPIVTIPIVSHSLGAEGLGTYQYVNTIAGYFVLIAGLGIQNYATREIAIVKQDRNKLSIIFWELFFLNFIVSFIVLLVYAIVTHFFRFPFYFFIQGMTVCSCLIDISWLYSGVEDFKKITLRNFFVRILSLILIIFFINNESDLTIYFIIMSGSTLLGQVSLWISIRYYVDWKKVSLKDIFRHLKPVFSFFIAKIAFQFYYNVSVTLLGVLSTIKNVAYFSNGVMLVTVAGSIVNSFSTVMIPRMSSLYTKSDESKMIEILNKTIHLQLYFTIGISFGILLINNKMIDWFFGSEFKILKTIIPLVTPILVFQTLQTSIASQYLIPKNEMRAYNSTVVIGAILCTLLDLIFIPFIGVYGAVIGYGMGYFVLCLLRSKVLIKTTQFLFSYKIIIRSFFCGLLMFLSASSITLNFPSNVFTTFFQLFIGFLLFFVFSIFFKINPLVKNNIFNLYNN